MSEDEIRVLKEKVEAEESTLKLRKRRSKSVTKSLIKLETEEASMSQPNGFSNDSPSPPLSFAFASNFLGNSKDAKSPQFTTHIHDRGILITKVMDRSPLIRPESPVDSLRIFRYNNSDLRSNRSTKDDERSHDSPRFYLAGSPSKNSVPLVSRNTLEEEIETSPPPLDLDAYKAPVSPSAFLNLLKDLSQQQHETVSDGSKISEVDEEMKKTEEEKQPIDVKELVSSPSFTALLNSWGQDVNTLFSSGMSPKLSPVDFETMLYNLGTGIPPSPTTLPTIPEIVNSPSASYLYNFYVDVVSKKVSIAPSSQNANSYQNVFLPLAHRDNGVLYGILAWAGYHLGGQWAEEGNKYAELALQHINNGLHKDKTLSGDRQSALNKLAALLILCGAEICKGDVKKWSVYLNWGWKILRSHGGILSFNKLKEEHWLISNFAYHDLLASSSTERGTYFPSKDYDEIFKDSQGFSRGTLNPLLGVSKKLYRIIGDISTLVYESKKILHLYYSQNSPSTDNESVAVSDSPELANDVNLDEDNESEISDHGRISRMLLTVIQKSRDLEKEIDESRPESDDLVGLTDEELELQLTLFEAFQLSAKLFLNQSIMKCNPSMLESQVIKNDLIKCIDILLGTPVQASLVFPVFMAGIHCVTNHDRGEMKKRMDEFMKLYGPWNVRRAKFIVEKVWESNPLGDNVVDWYTILKELQWDINFA